ncbi:MAG: AraC family transcriptional regulator [Anaerolineae bacterium]|nr:AraC family transcriptional regulator [Anaerolineae bacterium]
MSQLRNILAERRSYSEIACTHAHAHAQLILPLQGAISINTAQPHQLTEQALLFLPPHCQHTFYGHERNQVLVLDVPGSLCPGEEMRWLAGGLRRSVDDRWQALRFLLLSEVSDKPATHQAVTDLFHYAYRLLLQATTPHSIQYLHDHYAENIQLAALAALEGYNPTYYSEWFKKTTGLTASAYLQKLRLEEAKNLLAETDLPILHIAQQVGYEHHASLTRLFRESEQMSPAEYRRKTRKLVKAWPKMG